MDNCFTSTTRTIRVQLHSGIIEEVNMDMEKVWFIITAPRSYSSTQTYNKTPLLHSLKVQKFEWSSLWRTHYASRFSRNTIKLQNDEGYNYCQCGKGILQLELHPSTQPHFSGWGIFILPYRRKSKPVLFQKSSLRSHRFFHSETLNHHLELIRTKTAFELGKNLYVDSVMLSAVDTEDALRKYNEMKSIFGKAEINIREFSSNNENFNMKIPE